MDNETIRTYETMEREAEPADTEELYKKEFYDDEYETMPDRSSEAEKPILTKKEKWNNYMRKYQQEQKQNNTTRIFKVMALL
jgi:hypothetical protein